MMLGSRMLYNGTQHRSSGPYPSQSTGYSSQPPQRRDVTIRMEHRSLTAPSDGGRHFGVSYLFCAPEPLFHRRSFGLARGPQSQSRLVQQETLDGRQPSGGVTKGLLGVLRPGKKPGPLPLSVLTVTPRNRSCSWLVLSTCPLD